MISGVVLKEHKFVLKDDRDNPIEERTIFYIVPKTVRSANEAAAEYANVSQTDRKGETKVNLSRMNVADASIWVKAVKKVENYFCPVGAPEGGYDYFNAQIENNSVSEKKLVKVEVDVEKKVVGGIIVKSVTDEEDLKMIMKTMCPDHTEEVMNAFYNYSALEEGSKNV